MARNPKQPKTVESLTHNATRTNIPTAEYASIMHDEDKRSVRVAIERRNRDLDPQDWSDLVLDPTCGSGTTAYVAERGAGAGSPSTLRGWRWLWLGRALSVLPARRLA